jgi:hypothetical protein
LTIPNNVYPINKSLTSPRLSVDSRNPSAILNSMQSTTSSSSLGAIGTGIVPPPMHSQQSQYMQSTTPSVANGKDEMRGWLYKWTNVK